MSRNAIMAFLSISIVSATLLGVSSPSALATSRESSPALAPAFGNGEVSLENRGSLTGGSNTYFDPLGVCVFLTKGDYVHVSSSAFEASGHGWWSNINCRATFAVVTVQL